MRVIGVDEHVWRHTSYGDKFVTVTLDLTPIQERRGPSRLLDMVPGRSKWIFKAWLDSRPDTWRSHIEVVAMDGFTRFKCATAKELPDARAVMDAFHVVHLAGNALDGCHRRIHKTFTTGAGGQRIPCTRRTGCYTPDPAFSSDVSNTS